MSDEGQIDDEDITAAFSTEHRKKKTVARS